MQITWSHATSSSGSASGRTGEPPSSLSGDRLSLTGTDLDLTITVEVEVSGGGDEYALLGGLLALASLASLQFLVDTTSQGFEQSLNDVGTPIEVTTPAPGGPGGGTPDPTTPSPGGPGPGDPGPGDPDPGDPGPPDPPPAPPAQPGNPDSGSRWNESSMRSSSTTERECAASAFGWCYSWRDVTRVAVAAEMHVQRSNGNSVPNNSKATITVERFENGQWVRHTTVEATVRDGRISVDLEGIPETSQVRLKLTDVTGLRNGWDGQQSYIDFQI